MTDIGYLRREEYLESLVFSKGEEVKKLKEALVACKLEVNKLRAALEEGKALVFGANHSETRYPLARAALEGK